MATQRTTSEQELRTRLDRLVAQWEETADLIGTVNLDASHLVDRLRQQLERAISPSEQEQSEQDILPF